MAAISTSCGAQALGVGGRLKHQSGHLCAADSNTMTGIRLAQGVKKGLAVRGFCLNPIRSLLIQLEGPMCFHSGIVKQRPAACVRRNTRRATGVSQQPHAVVDGTPLDTVLNDQLLTDDQKKDGMYFDFLCPVCFDHVVRSGPSGFNRKALKRCSFHCKSCQRVYDGSAGFVDLTVVSGGQQYKENLPLSTSTFMNPVVSFVYERGWRQSFSFMGAPGADEEFRRAQEYLEPVKGGILLDASCGSGLFSRRFAQSGDYSAVIALDFSEGMLKQAEYFMQQDRSLDNFALALVRADIARLPFPSKSIDAVHAGAALHCWPSPSLAVAEICRVLKPGGMFVASTFLLTPSPLLDDIGLTVRQATSISLRNGQYYAWTERELKDLVRICGLVDFTHYRIGRFIMFAAKKP